VFWLETSFITLDTDFSGTNCETQKGIVADIVGAIVRILNAFENEVAAGSVELFRDPHTRQMRLLQFTSTVAH
jgi:hypothetical protein